MEMVRKGELVLVYYARVVTYVYAGASHAIDVDELRRELEAKILGEGEDALAVEEVFPACSYAPVDDARASAMRLKSELPTPIWSYELDHVTSRPGFVYLLTKIPLVDFPL